MGTCRFCDQPAGFFRTVHPECEAKHAAAIQQIAAEAASALRRADEFQPLPSRLEALAAPARVTEAEKQQVLITQWKAALDQYLEDGVLDDDEERRLTRFREQFLLTQSDLDRDGAFTKLVKAGALRELLSGKLPQRINIIGTLPVNLQKGEVVVWAFPNSGYLEDKVRRTYVGRTQGWNIRVMKGIYYRTSAFQGHPIDQTIRTQVDTGMVVLTNRNIYFAGSRKSVRVPYAKIISFEPYSDGIGVMRDAATAKPQVFVTGDGWFTFNLAVNLSQMSSES